MCVRSFFFYLALFNELPGVISTLATVFCVFVSIVAAAGILPAAHYGSISAFNVMSIFILIGVGASTVLLFASAWRR